MVNSIAWSVKTDTTHAQGHSQSPEPPDDAAVQRVVDALTAAARALEASSAAPDDNGSAPEAATRPVGRAVRADLSAGPARVGQAGGVAAMASDAHNNVHSESGGGGGGGGSRSVVNEAAMNSPRANLRPGAADAMHDNVHSESGHGASAQERVGQVSEQLRPMAARSARAGTTARQDAMHDNVHSESGHGSAARVSQGLQTQAQSAVRQPVQDTMHDNVHSESGHGAERGQAS